MDEDTIKITHFVNPHLFWFKRSEPRFIRRVELHCQLAIHNYCSEQYDAEETGPDGYYVPVPGEIVAVYDPARAKWTRNRVVDATIAEDVNIVDHTYQVWSLDEGVPKEAAAKHVKPLPSKFTHTQNVSVKQGALRNISAVHHFYDPDEGRMRRKVTSEWDSRINTELLGLIQNAEKTFFKNTTTHTIAGEEIEFGDLWFLTKQQKLIGAKDVIALLQVRVNFDDEEPCLESMTLNCTPSKTPIPETAEQRDANFTVEECSKENLEHAPITTDALPTSDLMNTASNKPRIVQEQLECVSSEQHAAKSIPEQPMSEENPSANDGLSACISSKIKLKQQDEVRDLGPIDLEALKSSVSLARLANRAKNLEPANALPKILDTNTASNKPRIVQEQFECVSSEQHAAKSIPEQPMSEENPSANDGLSACISSRIKLKQQDEVRDLGPIDLEALKSSVSLARLTNRAKNPEPANAFPKTLETDTVSNKPRIVQEQLGCVSSEHHAAKPVSEQAMSEEHPSANDGLSACISSRKKLKQQDEVRDLGPIDFEALKSSVSLARLVNRAKNPEPCHQPGEPANALQRKLARLNRAKSNQRKPAAVNSTRIETEAAESSPDTTSSETNEKILLTSEAAVDGSVDLTGGNKPFPVTIRPTGDTSGGERFLKEEQCVLSHLRHHRILVHGQNALKPIVSITAANFSPSVHQVLAHFGIRMVYRLQAYSWPHIMRGNSLVCVNSAGTGKTFAYLPAVCSLIKMLIEDGLVVATAGPIGIIVCRSSLEVQRIGYLCRRMLNTEAEKQMSVLECYGIRLVNQVCNKLFAGCAILVTTAPAYRRMYEAMPEAFVRKRIAMVVIDNIEQMLQHFGPDLQLLCKSCEKPDLQMIVTAAHWYPTLRGFLLRYNNMVALIGAYLEAAVYAQVQFQLRLRRNDGSKQLELVRFIRQHDYRTQRTIVFCSTADDVAQVVETLRQYSIQHLVCSASTTVHQHDGFRHWDDLLPGEMQLLVCLDEVFGDLHLSKAQHIVHYSLPDSWTCFTRRFATSFAYFEFPKGKRDGDEQPAARPSTLVLVDENNNQQLPKLIDFLELHHVEFPAELSALAQNIRNATEYERVNNGRACPLCPQLLALAHCRTFQSCAYRHVLMECDLVRGDSLPACGTVVRLNICHVFSPVHFSARLEAQREGHVDSSWTPLCSPNVFFLHDLRLQAHFANPERHQLYGKEVLPNDLCAMFHEQNYWRCRIVHFEPEGDSTTIGEVQLKHIDTGRMVYTKSTNLLALPEQFHALPGQAIEVRIAGVVPHDLEEQWDQDSTKHVQRWIDDHVQQPHHFVQGKVLLALRDTIWIDELRLTEQLDSVKTAVVTTKVASSIVSKHFGVYDRESFERIRHMVQKSVLPNMPTPKEDKRSPANASHSSTAARVQQIKDQNEPEPERSLDAAAGTSSKQKDLVRDAISPQILESQSLSTSPDRQTPLEGEQSKSCKNNSISSTSSFEILSPTRDKEEVNRFEALEKGEQYNVIIGQYFAPDLFYVYQIDTMIPIHENITAYTANASNIKPLVQLQVGVYCLFYFEDTYRRGQIVQVGEKETLKVFLLDFGGTILCYPESLIEIPDHLLRDYPFAAIEAKLGLIEPLEGSTWTEQSGDAIYDDVLERYNERGMVARVLQTLGPRHEAGAAAHQSVDGCHRYELLLADPDSSDPYSIVSELAQSRLAMVHWEDQEPGTDTEDEEDGSFVQLDFTHDELRTILYNITKEQSAAVSAATAAAAVEKNKATSGGRSSPSHPKKLAKENSTDTTNATVRRDRAKPAEEPATTALPRLECDFRFPQTVWWQADGFIILYVSAPDVIHYRLTVNIRSVVLQFFRDDQPYVMALNLFGPIDPEHTIHGVRGLSIVICLARLPGSTWRWPYLLNHNAKLPWLKQAINPPRYRRTSLEGSSGSESSADLREFEWSELLPTRLDDMLNATPNSSEDEEHDDLGLQPEGAMEDEIFYHR